MQVPASWKVVLSGRYRRHGGGQDPTLKLIMSSISSRTAPAGDLWPEDYDDRAFDLLDCPPQQRKERDINHVLALLDEIETEERGAS